MKYRWLGRTGLRGRCCICLSEPQADVPDRARGAAAGTVASNRAVRQQRVEADHGRLKSRLRPMRGLTKDRNARVIVVGHAFVQNVRRAHYELAVEEPVTLRLAVAFDELALAICSLDRGAASACHPSTRCNRALRPAPSLLIMPLDVIRTCPVCYFGNHYGV